jgi:hypothetical protein
MTLTPKSVKPVARLNHPVVPTPRGSNAGPFVSVREMTARNPPGMLCALRSPWGCENEWLSGACASPCRMRNMIVRVTAYTHFPNSSCRQAS